MGGELFSATRNSEIVLSGLGGYDNGRIVAVQDETSVITTKKRSGTIFNSGAQIPNSPEGEQLLFVARNVITSTASLDIVLKHVFAGSQYIPTRLEVYRKSGGQLANAAVIQLYTGPNATGTALLNENGAAVGMGLSGLTSQGQLTSQQIKPQAKVTLTGGGASTQATIGLIVNEQGVVTSASVLTPGVGYTGQPTQTFSGVNGVQLTLTVDTGLGTITAVSIVKAGSGFVRQVMSNTQLYACLLYTSPSPRDLSTSRMPSSA